jgi:imidazole glycerol phosphate synthase glutamine amidotransferase subunit
VIAIFDYGAGNLRSVQNTLDAIGCEYTLVRDAAGLERATKILLPGVGHFGQMMRALDQLEVRDALKDRIATGVPFLGICLGLQALFDASEEAPEVSGLGIFEGIVRRFPAHARVPHMGWDELELRGQSQLVRGIGQDRPQAGAADETVCPTSEDPAASSEDRAVSFEGPEVALENRVGFENPAAALVAQAVSPASSPFVYFAHSYYAPEGDYASAICTYEVPFTAALEVGNVYGVQFHPEKSGAIGLAIVRNFVEC